MAECNVNRCDRQVYARGWCNAHYMRWRRHGDIDAGSPIGQSRAIQFLKAVLAGDPTDECVIWPFCQRTGYGNAWWKGRVQQAHRVMLILATGGDQPDLLALHTPVICHMSSCVNPRHLRWGTPKENMADKNVDGTDSRGERNGSSKLTEPDVVAIHEASRNGETQQSIAARFGVAQSTISEIVNRKKWSHVR